MVTIQMGNTLTCVLSSGNWNNSSNAGVWNVNWNNNRTNSNNNVSFRCDYNSVLKPRKRTVELQGCVIQPWAKSNFALLFGRLMPKTRRVFS
jgi:hypothetical protein